MTEAFTKKDRDFIIKIAKECDALKKRVKILEDEKKVKPFEKAPVKPDTTFVSRPNKDGAIKTQFKMFGNDSAIDVTYSHNPPSILEQRALVTSLYKTLYELCDDNGISSLTVQITPKE